ncbi:TetR/AcrR family transcriptional regulator [Maritalea sp. S77]|uniref:TetR/AcrR family transcriptional regulator n=1 Tax=Maritalea sp. S77 TaxID=3415125 RepID=UPI003C7B5BD5
MTSAPANKMKSARVKLSRKLIVEKALSIVRGEGLNALTMRRVATDLNTGAMSLYRHVSDRDDLLLSMMDHVATGIEQPTKQSDHRAEILAIMLTLHRTFRDDPWVVNVLLFEGRGSLKILPLLERLFSALAQLGCDTRLAIEYYSLLINYAYGENLSHQTKTERWRAQEDLNGQTFADYPSTKEVFEAERVSFEETFERNIKRIIEGIKPNAR